MYINYIFYICYLGQSVCFPDSFKNKMHTFVKSCPQVGQNIYIVISISGLEHYYCCHAMKLELLTVIYEEVLNDSLLPGFGNIGAAGLSSE